MFHAAVVSIKHPGFYEELEWRAIYSPTVRHSVLMKSSTVTIAGVPQLIYHLPLDGSSAPDIDLVKMLERIIVGPRQFPTVVLDSLIPALEKMGVAEPAKKIQLSNIPIRG